MRDDARRELSSPEAQRQAEEQRRRQMADEQSRQQRAIADKAAADRGRQGGQAGQLRDVVRGADANRNNPAAIAETQRRQEELRRQVQSNEQLRRQPPVPGRPPIFMPVGAPRPGAGRFGVDPRERVQHFDPPMTPRFFNDRDGRLMPSHRGNPETYRRIGDMPRRMDEWRGRTDRGLLGRVDGNRDTFMRNHYREVERREHERFERYWYTDRQYRDYYSGWQRHGFYGGYYYPVDHCDRDRFERHFHNPVVYWLYVDSWDPDYYTTWYDPYVYYRSPVRPFRYPRVYYPTTTIVDISTDVSYEPYDRQWGFRTAMTNLTDALVQEISNQLTQSFVLSENDIVVNHYERLNASLFELEGFVDRDWLHVPFKAIINIDNPADFTVFVPTSKDPTDADLLKLAQINNIMTQNGHDPRTPFVEPAPPVLVDNTLVACTTFSSDVTNTQSELTFNNSSADAGVALNGVVDACIAGSTFESECRANVSCVNDGNTYADVVTCTATSAGLSFSNRGRSADVAYTQAVKFCTAADGTNADECAQTALASCSPTSSGTTTAVVSCQTYSKGQTFQGQPSFSHDTAKQSALDMCNAATGTTADTCDLNLYCSDTQ